MKKKEININNQRISFSKNIKRKVLLEVAKGESPENALLKHGLESLKEISEDKKYAAKLLHKWRKEMYENKEILNLLAHNIDKSALKEEIENMGTDEEEEKEGFSVEEIDLIRNCSKEIIIIKNSN